MSGISNSQGRGKGFTAGGAGPGEKSCARAKRVRAKFFGFLAIFGRFRGGFGGVFCSYFALFDVLY